MTECLTAAQMRSLERAAIESGAVTGLALMERAGRGVVEAMFAQWPELARTAHRALVLCGPGNNGGDGFVIARLLKERGWSVDVILYGASEKLPPDARTNYDRWCDMGAVTERSLTQAPAKDTRDTPPDLLVDAIFGTGLTRPIPDALTHLPVLPARVVAVDVPSGLCADSGKPLGTPIKADLTVSFHALKLGHLLDQGPFFCGRAVVAGIGLAPYPATAEGVVHAVEPDPADLAKGGAGHKFTHGHALVLSGPSGRTGAARLAARAALRVGAGLVTVATPHDALAENAAQLTAIMLTETDAPEALAEVLKDTRINALCVGPAFGIDRARDILPAVLAAQRPTVLDADALTALAQDAALFAMLHAGCVLTPHAGEFKRLFPDIAAQLDAPPVTGPAYSKVDAARDAGRRAGCTVVMKGPDTVVAAPDGRASVNATVYERSAPWLATAGAGDVLAGLVAGLMARGLAPYHAAGTATYLHTEAARRFGPGLIAEDLPETLPNLFRALGV
ncbi:NAD(P)H-hydrate dehydratase [Celeribacter sp.]|uniref:NAD(P)H-hydrate dehydratase n=1 Tax=Celeribacter sp. TaxID=1890673 RepID=UPI003A91CCE4